MSEIKVTITTAASRVLNYTIPQPPRPIVDGYESLELPKAQHGQEDTNEPIPPPT